MNTRPPESEPLLTPAEVATMFRVDPKTVTRWAKAGKISSIRTLGGHRRYRESEVLALLEAIPAPRGPPPAPAASGGARSAPCWRRSRSSGRPPRAPATRLPSTELLPDRQPRV